MMKGPKKTVLAVRHITTGEIIIEDGSLKGLNLPVIKETDEEFYVDMI